MEELVAWLTGVLDDMERVAHAADPIDGVTRDDALNVEREHVYLHVPGAVVARVEAERALVEAHAEAQREDAELGSRQQRYSVDEDAYDVVSARASERANTMEDVLRLLAYGHRFDAPGYCSTWAPGFEDAE